MIIEISDSEEDLNELNKEKMLISRFTERLNYDTKLLKKYENERTITDRDEDYFE